MAYSTYVFEVPSLLRADWLDRHARFGCLRFRTQCAVASRMSPCELLSGSWTGQKPSSVIALRDDPRRQSPTTTKGIAVKKQKKHHVKTKGIAEKKQLHLCRFFGMDCCRHAHEA